MASALLQPHPCSPSYGWTRLQEHAITSDEALALEALPTGPIVVLGGGWVLWRSACMATCLQAGLCMAPQPPARKHYCH